MGAGRAAEGGFAIVYVAAVLCALQIARALPYVWPWAHVWRCAVCICTKSTASCALNTKSVAAPNHKTPPTPTYNTHTRAFGAACEAEVSKRGVALALMSRASVNAGLMAARPAALAGTWVWRGVLALRYKAGATGPRTRLAPRPRASRVPRIAKKRSTAGYARWGQRSGGYPCACECVCLH